MSKYYNDSQIQDLMNKEISIKIKSSQNNIKEAIDFIDRYLSLNLDEFNASSLLKKLREILTRGNE